MGQILLKLVIQYVEAHPDQVVDLIHAGVDAGINAIKKHTAANQPAK